MLLLKQITEFIRKKYLILFLSSFLLYITIIQKCEAIVTGQIKISISY